MDLLGGYSSSDDDSDAGKPPKQIKTDAKPSSRSSLTAVAPQEEPSANKRGKKMISLAAVLPRHIFDQLTKSQVKGQGDDDDSDDDSDEERFALKRRQEAKAPTNTGLERDPELSSLLSELQSAPTAGFVASSFLSKPKATQEPLETLGAAFVTATTRVERKSTKGQAVRNIHQDADTDMDAVMVEIVNKKVDGSESEQATTTHRPTQSTVTSVAPNAIPLAAPRVFRPSAAPRVSAAPGWTEKSGAESSGVVSHAYPIGQETTGPIPYSDDADEGFNKHNSNNPRKRSRKELERALRHGQLDAVEGDISVQAETNLYNPSAASLSAAPPSEFGIRVAPTAMYDPSIGGVAAGQARGRGKNQINHVMAAAAQLEEHRRQQYQRDGSGAANGKTHRANAKQKYGW